MNENVTPSEAADPVVPVTEPDEARTNSPPRQRLLVTALCIAASLSFYVLSAGPMSGLAHTLKLRSFNNAVEVVYAPLIVIVKKDIRPVSTALRWYAGLFR
jgi:hypothetical protein